MKIGIDMMGGDNPQEIVGAIKRFLGQEKNITVVCYAKEGNENIKSLEAVAGVEFVYCSDEIQKDDDPAFVVRKRKDSSLIVGTQQLKDREISAFISAGNTGAIVAAGIFVLKRKNNISKPALPVLLPKKGSNTPVMVLDVGANIYATKENMIQYAQLAKDYMQTYYGLENPSIKLLNIGEEENKGTDLQKELYQELKSMEFNFQGNIEPRDILNVNCDIVLTDGWTGNIMLKSLEGAVEFMGASLKQVFYKNIINKISAKILEKDLRKMQKELDYREFGATPVIGVDGLLLKSHGSSDEEAFFNALKQARRMIEQHKNN